MKKNFEAADKTNSQSRDYYLKIRSYYLEIFYFDEIMWINEVTTSNFFSSVKDIAESL